LLLKDRIGVASGYAREANGGSVIDATVVIADL
jgi:hypothetical protein